MDNGVNNAFDLREFNESFARKKRGIVLQRTIVELKGIVCNEVENLLVKKKSIIQDSHNKIHFCNSFIKYRFKCIFHFSDFQNPKKAVFLIML